MGGDEILVEVDDAVLMRLDRLIAGGWAVDRKQTIREAITESIRRLELRRLEAECENLDPAEESAWAELGFGADSALWPEY